VSLRTVVAAAFKHLRKERLQKVEFIYYIAIDRKWMNKEEATLLLERARDTGLIVLQDGVYLPGFDLVEVDIPLGFKPSTSVLRTEDPIERLISEIAERAGTDQRAIYAEMNMITHDHFDDRLLPEAAVMILARRYQVDARNYRDELMNSLIKQGDRKPD